jgi:hypothetical protein
MIYFAFGIDWGVGDTDLSVILVLVIFGALMQAYLLLRIIQQSPLHSIMMNATRILGSIVATMFIVTVLSLILTELI